MNCATCKHRIETGGKLGAAGFVRCKLLPEWQWLPGHEKCRFEPVKWERNS